MKGFRQSFKFANAEDLKTGGRVSAVMTAPWAFLGATRSAVCVLVKGRPVLAIIALNLILLGSGSWSLPLVDRDEPRFAEASREMLQRHDWTIPWFNGQYRFDKPPWIYWCQMLCFRWLGEGQFAARVPSILFATATAVLLFYWGRRLADEDLGKRAAVYFSTCLAMLVYGRLSFADMPLIFFMMCSVWSGWELTRPDAANRFVWWGLLSLSLGLGFLAKGPVAWLPVVGLAMARLARPAEYSCHGIKIFCAFLMGLALVALWGVPALLATGGEYLRVGIGHHVIFRSFHVLEGHGGNSFLSWVLSLLFFVPVFFVGFFPWSLWFPKLLWRWHRMHSANDALGNYLLIQCLAVFGTFTLVRTKLPHYILPAFPCLALWLARENLVDPIPNWVKPSSRWAVRMGIITVIITTFGFGLAKPSFIASSLFRQAKPLLKTEMKFATIDYVEPSLVWEFRKVLTNNLEILTVSQAGDFLRQPGSAVLLVSDKFSIDQLELQVTNGYAKIDACGFDLPHGKRVKLTAFIKSE